MKAFTPHYGGNADRYDLLANLEVNQTVPEVKK
ncbi:hypothetical protein ambt_18565 [Alteromonas naphthalenivorans]|uniref:Uncharacterized protein n=1 Tax=Alteromonas naphthalenivorans TaxID=715451 RepID=F5Z5X3_ALTNA|nr:hypothetical protein ambt_18565 [Alteromonas naphthalenivorans]